MKNIRVHISAGEYACTPSNKEEDDNAVMLQFNDEDANRLIDGYSVKLSPINERTPERLASVLVNKYYVKLMKVCKFDVELDVISIITSYKSELEALAIQYDLTLIESYSSTHTVQGVFTVNLQRQKCFNKRV